MVEVAESHGIARHKKRPTSIGALSTWSSGSRQGYFRGPENVARVQGGGRAILNIGADRVAAAVLRYKISQCAKLLRIQSNLTV